VLVLQISKNCYETIESELQKNKSITQKTVGDSIQRLRVFGVQSGMDMKFLPRKNDQPYQIIVGNYTQIDSVIKAQIAGKEEYEKMLQEQLLFIQTALEQVSSLRKIENYAAAILILEDVIDQPFFEREELIIEAQDVQSMMVTLKKEENAKKFNLYVQIADSAFTKENYSMAKEYFLQAKQIDATAQPVLHKLKEIEKIESMLIIRQDSIFNYVSYHELINDTIETRIFNKLRKCFLSVDAGDIDFTYTLQTDISGQNVSSYQINTFSLRPVPKLSEEAWASFLDTLILLKPIPPVKIDYLYVNAATPFQNQSTWNSSLIKVSKGKKIKFSPKYTPKAERTELYDYFKSNTLFPFGKYVVEKKKIIHQDSVYTTLALKKVSTVGPEAMLYSLLFPGVGSIAATQGKKGWGIMVTSVLFYGAGIAGIFVSENLKNQAITDPDKQSTANIVKYAAFGSIGVGAIIHFSGIFVALKQGITNLEKSRALKRKLKVEPVYIQEFPQQPEL
jgi:tetratricopeptide (TPR) repeat protein